MPKSYTTVGYLTAMRQNATRFIQKKDEAEKNTRKKQNKPNKKTISKRWKCFPNKQNPKENTSNFSSHKYIGIYTIPILTEKFFF